MTPEPVSLAGQSLLVVLAHPDDESLACGGLLARAASLGVRTALLCLTRGAGVPADPQVARTRTMELKAAAGVLGVGDTTVLDYDDGYLPWADHAALERDIRRAIDLSRANVVITFDADGLYWHPDHIAVHDRVTETVAALGADAPALYYVSMPAGQMIGLTETVAARVGRPLRPGILGIIAVDAFGAEAPSPTHAVDVSEESSTKLRALRCHATQAADSVLAHASDDDARTFLGVEHYRRAPGGPDTTTFLDTLAATTRDTHT